MNENYEYIGKLASFLVENKTRMSGRELVDHLNRNNFKTTGGTPYLYGRGIFSFLSKAYDYFKNKKDIGIASDIAYAFVKEDGNIPWK